MADFRNSYNKAGKKRGPITEGKLIFLFDK